MESRITTGRAGAVHEGVDVLSISSHEQIE